MMAQYLDHGSCDKLLDFVWHQQQERHVIMAGSCQGPARAAAVIALQLHMPSATSLTCLGARVMQAHHNSINLNPKPQNEHAVEAHQQTTCTTNSNTCFASQPILSAHLHFVHDGVVQRLIAVTDVLSHLARLAHNRVGPHVHRPQALEQRMVAKLHVARATARHVSGRCASYVVPWNACCLYIRRSYTSKRNKRQGQF